MKKRLLSALVVSVMAISVFSGCSAIKEAVTAGAAKSTTGQKSKKFIVGYAGHVETNVFLKIVKDTFEEKVKPYTDIETVYTSAGDFHKQLEQIDNFIEQKVDAIALVSTDYEGVVPGVEKANKAGIPVIAVNVQVPGGKATFVGSKNYDEGKLQGEYMAKNLPENAKIIYIEGTPGFFHTTERKRGFKENCLDKRPDVELLASLTANFDKAEAVKLVEDLIQTFPEFDAIVAANDQMALGAIEALKAANRLEGVMVSGVDGTTVALNAIKAGEMSQSVLQDAEAQAEKVLEVVQAIKNGEKSPANVIIQPESITKDNLNKFLK